MSGKPRNFIKEYIEKILEKLVNKIKKSSKNEENIKNEEDIKDKVKEFFMDALLLYLSKTCKPRSVKKKVDGEEKTIYLKYNEKIKKEHKLKIDEEWELYKIMGGYFVCGGKFSGQNFIQFIDSIFGMTNLIMYIPNYKSKGVKKILSYNGDLEKFRKSVITKGKKIVSNYILSKIFTLEKLNKEKLKNFLLDFYFVYAKTKNCEIPNMMK